jgi:anthranilate phosphoribosyltransferase
LIDARKAIEVLYAREDLSSEDMSHLMREIMSGSLPELQIAGFLTALQVKGLTVEEVHAAASVMREFSLKVSVNDTETLVDTCGTGGDGVKTFNISTAAAFVVAAAGGRVAKHGGRSVSSSSGSADVLEALGVNIALTPQQVAKCIDEAGVGFMFAPSHHTAMKYAGPVRKELGVRTIFNILGPLTNPADAKIQVMGVFDRSLLRLQAEVLKKFGSRRALIVRGDDGLDEISPVGATSIAELCDGVISEYSVSPSLFGMDAFEISNIRVETKEEAVEMFRAAISGRHDFAVSALAMNAGAAIYAADICTTLEDGVDLAKQLIGDGSVKRKFEAFVAFTNAFKSDQT